MRSARTGASLLALGLLVVGCSSTAEPPAADPGPAGRTGPPALVALGDSISVGFAACGRAQACPAESWVTGDDPAVDSLARRLTAAWDGADISVTNLAHPGARVADVATQAERVPQDLDGLVTVLVGVNDVCATSAAAMTEPTDFRASIDRTLQTIAERAPEAVVLVASVPDLTGVWSALKHDPAARARWAEAGSCRSVSAGTETTAVARRVDDLDSELHEACSAVDTCVFDDGTVHDWVPAREDLSDVDVFHPATSGQAELAERLWTRALDDPVTVPLMAP